MSKVLITGMFGFAGSHLFEHIMATTDWDIVTIASWQHKGIPERIYETDAYQKEPGRLEVITHDLTAPLSRIAVQKLKNVDYIINAAAQSHVDRSISEPVSFVQNNVDLMLNMLELAREIKPKVFIQISTDEVYGPAPIGINHPEWSSILPSNPYSASKASQEAIAISYWRTYNVPLVITNTMNMFGERQDSEKYVSKLIKEISSGAVAQVHGDEKHIGSRFYLHARNHADALVYIINNLPPQMYEDGEEIVKPSRYNIVGNIEVNNLEMAQYIADIMNKPLQYALVDFHHTRPGHDRRYALDGIKIANLGWQPPLSFVESLERTVKWMLEHSEWL